MAAARVRSWARGPRSAIGGSRARPAVRGPRRRTGPRRRRAVRRRRSRGASDLRSGRPPGAPSLVPGRRSRRPQNAAGRLAGAAPGAALTAPRRRHTVALCRPARMPRRRPPSGTAPSPTSRRAACRRATRTGRTAWPGIPPRSRSSTSSRPPKRQPNLVFTRRTVPGRADARPTTCSATGSTSTGRTCGPPPSRTPRRRTRPRAARCTCPALAGIEGPLALLEVGASAGLCLYPDRYSYRYTRAPAARPRRRPQRGGARLRGRTGRCRCRIACPRSPGAAASTSTRSTCGVPTTSRGSMRWSGPSTTIAASASARRPRSRHPTRPASSRATSTTGWPRSPPRRPPTPPSSSSTPRCSCTSTTPGRARFADLVRDLPGHWLSVEGRAVTPGIRVRDDVENDSTDLVLALDGVQLAWAQPHGRAIRWVPNP